MDTPNQDGGTTPVKKQSTSETGHAVNVANFKLLFQILEKHGDAYAPASTELSLKALEVLLDKAEKTIKDCLSAETNFDTATDHRADLYKQLQPLSMRAVTSFRSSSVAQSAIDGANTIIHKIQGRASKVKKKDILSNTNEGSQSISNSQQSYVQQVQHFKSLNDLFVMYPEYAPNESDLQTTALSQFADNLNTGTDNVNDAIATWSKARNIRNTLLYTPKIGMVDIAKRVKKYMASNFGSTSNYFKDVNKIRFRSINK